MGNFKLVIEGSDVDQVSRIVESIWKEFRIMPKLEELDDAPLPEATSYKGYGGSTFSVGDRVKDWYGRHAGTVTHIYKKSAKSMWYVKIDILGRAGEVELKAADCSKVGV